MENEVIVFDDRNVNYLLLIKRNYENLLYKNKEFVETLNSIHKDNPYNIISPIDIRLLYVNDNISEINVNIEKNNRLLKNQIEEIDRLLNKYCDHAFVKDTIETKNEVLVDVEYCANCYLNKE